MYTISVTKKYVDKSKAPKRGKNQIIRDRKRVSELILQGYSHQDIADLLYSETGIKLSRRTITADVSIIRKDWLQERRDNYDELIDKELARCDSTEREMWRAWRLSCSDTEKKIVEEIARQLADDDEEYELIVKKVITTVEGSSGDPRFLDKIIQVQRERRRLLGLYAPARLGIDIRQKNELIIKGYAVRDASPDAWPSLEDGNIIEGEYESK